MDALTALTVGGLGGLVGYCLAKGEPLPTEAQLLKALEENKPRLTHTIQIDTTVARDKERYPISGQSLFVLNPQDPSQPVYICLNEPESDQIELTAQRTIKAPFYRFFITNMAGSGTLTIIVNKASVVELNAADVNVNIVAQAISNLLMTFNAQNVGIYLQPEWAALHGEEKQLHADGINQPFGFGAYLRYTVPAGKTLYINGFTGKCRGEVVTNTDVNQIVAGELYIGGFLLVELGGNGGYGISFSTPIVVSAGVEVAANAMVHANHGCRVSVSIIGYEI